MEIVAVNQHDVTLCRKWQALSYTVMLSSLNQVQSYMVSFVLQGFAEDVTGLSCLRPLRPHEEEHRRASRLTGNPPAYYYSATGETSALKIYAIRHTFASLFRISASSQIKSSCGCVHRTDSFHSLLLLQVPTQNGAWQHILHDSLVLPRAFLT